MILFILIIAVSLFGFALYHELANGQIKFGYKAGRASHLIIYKTKQPLLYWFLMLIRFIFLIVIIIIFFNRSF